jgi:hypothetical protein
MIKLFLLPLCKIYFYIYKKTITFWEIIRAMEKKFAENDYVRLSIEGSILFLEYKPETNITLGPAKEVLNLISLVGKKDKYLVLQDMNNLKWIDKQSRDLFASHPVISQMHAWAYHSKQPLHKIMYTIFVTFSKPEIKTEFFNTRESGLKWLGEICQNEI